MDQKFKDIHRNMAKTSKIEQSEDGRRPFEAHRERDTERSFFFKVHTYPGSCSLIDSLIILIRNFHCDEKFVDLWRKLSFLFKERQAFHQDFVAPAVEACAIVASDCLQRSRHSSPCHIPSEASPTGQAFRGTHIMCNRPPDQARQQRQ